MTRVASDPQLRATDALLDGQRSALEMIVLGRPLPEVLAELCRLVDSQSGDARAAILLVDPAGGRLEPGAAPSLPEDFVRATEGLAIAEYGTCPAAAARRAAVVTCDLAADPGWAGLRDLALAAGLRAAWSLPIVGSDGGVLGTFGTYFTRTREPHAHERRLVEVLARTASLAIERRRADAALRASEARARAIVEANPEAVMVVAPDGTLTQMNPAGLALVELDEPAALGRSFAELVAPEHRAAYQRFHEQVCGGSRGALAFDVIGAGGTRRSMEATAVPLPVATGGHAQLAVARDVSARVAADRALAAQQARLDYAVRLSGVGFWYCDLPFDELQWDERVKRHFFLPPDARVTIETFFARLHPDDRERIGRDIDTAMAERTGYDVIYRTVDPDTGATKWIRALGGAAYDDKGMPHHFDGVTVDVTAQRRDQERLTALLERERQQIRLLERVAEAGVTIHSSGSLESALRVVAAEAQRIVGADWARTSVVAAADADSLATAVPGEPGDVPAERLAELRELVADSRRPVRRSDWLGVPLLGRDGGVLGLVELAGKRGGVFDEADEAVVVQLGQIAAVAIDNARLYDELREQDRRKDEFLATLAHELRNPLAPIRTGLHVLRLARSEEDAARTREMMERQVGHMVRLIDDLLDVSRITRGKLTLRRERVELRAVIESALETTRPLVEAHRHDVRVSLPAESLPLDADPTRLAQVFANLVNNAARYTPAGGSIAIDAAIEGGALAVRVSDDGIGIAPEILPRIFDMFTQGGRSPNGAQAGLGIGLTLVQRLVELHGGRVEAASPGPGGGSTFTIRLPLAAGARSESPAARAPSPIVAPQRILVVDDNIDGAEMLAAILEIGGHATRTAHTGPDALAAAREFQPDLVFLDIGLPELSGYDVARRLRAESGARRPLLVAVTGWGSDEDRRRARDAGFDLHLVKPIGVEQVDAVLAAAGPRLAAAGA